MSNFPTQSMDDIRQLAEAFAKRIMEGETPTAEEGREFRSQISDYLSYLMVTTVCLEDIAASCTEEERTHVRITAQYLERMIGELKGTVRTVASLSRLGSTGGSLPN